MSQHDSHDTDHGPALKGVRRKHHEPRDWHLREAGVKQVT